ncbi:MAG TPA: hypothetical protein VK399_03680 [Longimicrobiaceae bacterium]|jgi:hypothetical protein|nr:hypothetical protein [Longimicrobiaceae bacterium]
MGAHTRFLQHIDTVHQAGIADQAVEQLFEQIREMARERDAALSSIEEWKTQAEDAARRAERAARQIELWKQQVAEHIMDLDRRLKSAEQGSGVLKHRNWFLEGTLRAVYEWYETNPQQLPDTLAMLLTASLLPTQTAPSSAEPEPSFPAQPGSRRIGPPRGMPEDARRSDSPAH